jgi:hypothetical protein
MGSALTARFLTVEKKAEEVFTPLPEKQLLAPLPDLAAVIDYRSPRAYGEIIRTCMQCCANCRKTSKSPCNKEEYA